MQRSLFCNCMVLLAQVQLVIHQHPRIFSTHAVARPGSPILYSPQLQPFMCLPSLCPRLDRAVTCNQWATTCRCVANDPAMRCCSSLGEVLAGPLGGGSPLAGCCAWSTVKSWCCAKKVLVLPGLDTATKPGNVCSGARRSWFKSGSPVKEPQYREAQKSFIGPFTVGSSVSWRYNQFWPFSFLPFAVDILSEKEVLLSGLQLLDDVILHGQCLFLLPNVTSCRMMSLPAWW